MKTPQKATRPPLIDKTCSVCRAQYQAYNKKKGWCPDCHRLYHDFYTLYGRQIRWPKEAIQAFYQPDYRE